jgi:transposase-like protein
LYTRYAGSRKYIAYKDAREAIADLKRVYKAANRDEGALALDAFEARWGKSYPAVVRSWRLNWEKLTTFLAYPEARSVSTKSQKRAPSRLLT